MNKLDMRMIRSFFNGEIPGARKMIFFTVIAIAVWTAGVYYLTGASRAKTAYTREREQLITLDNLSGEYKQLVAERGGKEKTAPENLVFVLSKIIEDAGMRDRLLQVSPSARGDSVSISMDGLYAEDVVTILSEFGSVGIRITAAELRPAQFQQDKRLFTFSAVLEVED